jgi:hypothetical protein
MTVPKLPFTGGCVCGAIRYECSAAPIMMFKCHCRDCQQVTGGGFVPGPAGPRVRIPPDEGATVLPFHTEPGRRQTQAGFLSRMRLAADWWRVR